MNLEKELRVALPKVPIGFACRPVRPVAPGVEMTETVKFDRPGILESLHFPENLLPMEKFSLKLERVTRDVAGWVKMGAIRIREDTILIEIVGGSLVTSTRIEFALFGKTVPVNPGDILHLSMGNYTDKDRVLVAVVWMVEVDTPFDFEKMTDKLFEDLEDRGGLGQKRD